VPHEPRQESGWHCFYAVFYPRPHWYAWLQFPEAAQRNAVLRLGGTPLFAAIRRLLLLADCLYRGGAPDREARAMLVLERALLALRARRQAQLDERVQKALAFINSHYARALTIADIARAAHSSVSHLSTLFHQQVGASPIQVLEQVRLQRAQEMLRLSFASVGEVAAAVGYRSPSYFIQRFRRHSGQTPRAFRRAANRGG
jgi:AraC family transcriptional regulator of arabinose operon